MSIKSGRAKKLFESSEHFGLEKDPQMKKFPGSEFTLWAKLDWQDQNVKKLSFFGEVSDFQKVILQSMASLLIGKPIAFLDNLTVRECEAYLRDKNSEQAIEGMTEVHENELKKVFQWVRAWPRFVDAKEYDFHSGNGPFSQLKLTDKIKEMKAFLNSPEILTLYKDLARPELVDVEDLTVYINAPYETQRDKNLFEKLHLLGVETFQEENLNFIPDV